MSKDRCAVIRLLHCTLFAFFENNFNGSAAACLIKQGENEMHPNFLFFSILELSEVNFQKMSELHTHLWSSL